MPRNNFSGDPGPLQRKEIAVVTASGISFPLFCLHAYVILERSQPLRAGSFLQSVPLSPTGVIYGRKLEPPFSILSRLIVNLEKRRKFDDFLHQAVPPFPTGGYSPFQAMTELKTEAPHQTKGPMRG